MSSNLIINERPLIIIPSLAKAIGLNESIILQQLHYWLQRSKNIRMDRKWVYFTYENLAEQFPFFSVSTIRRVIGKLEEKGLLQSGHFNKMKMDHTKWYSINYEALDGLSTTTLNYEKINNKEANCSMIEDNIFKEDSPSVQNEQKECSNWTDEQVKTNSPIPKSTSKISPKNTLETSTKNDERNDQGNPYRFYEENGFGLIGSFISEKISAWCIDLSDELVVEAMKIAVENSSKKWSYVEAILKDWVDKGYQTVDDVQAARLAGRPKHQKHKVGYQPARKEILPDWFKNRENSSVELDGDINYEEEKKKFLDRRRKYLEKQGNNE
ncbi:DnaD domain protein [Cytobacillus suaedae]|nr:DnaD domain protein [Cytobacillus suaedae]